MLISVRMPIVEKRPLLKIKLSKEFETKVRPTRRVVEVAEAFGIGVDETKRFVVYRDFELEVFPGDVVYVTGESGSGKSILLKELARSLSKAPEFGKVVDAWSIEIDPNEVLIQGVGSDISDAIEKLSMAGLNEAFLFVRRYRELSDGQKYRYRIAKLMDSGADVWVLDEFASILDRVTARVVAYLIQKVARRLGKTLLVATTHEDLIDDLNPTLIVKKRFGELGAEVRRLSYSPRPCTLLSEIRIERGSLSDYKRLESFHYISGRPAFVTDVFKAVHEGEVVGAIVYTKVARLVSGRFEALPHLRELYRKDLRGYLALISKEFKRIARVVVAPKFRGIGLGVRLVRETLPQVGARYVETLAVMARYNPFFEHAGMRRVNAAPQLYEKISTWFESKGFDVAMMGSKEYNLSMLRRMGRAERMEVYEFVMKTLGYLRRGRRVIKRLKETGPDLELMAEALRLRPLPVVYLIWER